MYYILGNEKFILLYTNVYTLSPCIAIGLVLVGVIWGSTNPFLERGSKKEENKKGDVSFRAMLKTILNKDFIIPFLLNQSGSLVYYFLMGKTGKYEMDAGHICSKSF